MLIRFYIKCDHCGKITILRLAIGTREKEPFYFECENCSQSISGTLVLDQKNIKIKSLELDGASKTDSEEGDYILTYDPNFSHQGGETLEGITLTPFLQGMDRHSNMIETIQRIAWLNTITQGESNSLGRIIRNYKAENWPQFETGIQEYIDDNQPITLPIDRNRALYQILELSLAPIATSKNHTELIDFFAYYIINLSKTYPSELRNFLETINKTGLLKEIQYEALDMVPRFLQVLDEFRPVLSEWDPEHPDKDFPSNLRVTGKSKYHDIKALYVDAYELISRALTIVTGLINLTHRGNYDVYPIHPTLGKKFFPSNIEDFHIKSHAPKLDLLKEEPKLYSWLANSLDSKLRNAIGHNSITYNSKNGDIKYATNKKSAKFTTISYGEFLTKVLRIFLRTHQVNHLVKILFVQIYFDEMKKE